MAPRNPNSLHFAVSGAVALQVIKGPAPGPADAPHRVDGLSGATLTSNGVSALVQFWMGENGYGPYFTQLKAEGSGA